MSSIELLVSQGAPDPQGRQPESSAPSDSSILSESQGQPEPAPSEVLVSTDTQDQPNPPASPEPGGEQSSQGGILDQQFNRRTVLKGIGAGLLGLAAVKMGLGAGNDAKADSGGPSKLTKRGFVPGVSADGVGAPEQSTSDVEVLPGLPFPDKKYTDTLIQPYAKAYTVTPENVSLQYRKFKDADGKEFVVGTDNLNGVPILMADKKDNGEWNSWREATLGALGKKRNVLMGTSWGGAHCTADDFRRIDETLRREFDLMGIYVGMGSTQSQEGVFNLDFNGKTADEAYANNMPIFVGPLVYYKGSPDWFMKLPRDKMIEAMNGQIKGVMGEMKKHNIAGKSIYYKVLNEAYDNNNFLMHTIGPEYVDIAFQTARATDPSAILIYTDYDNHTRSGGEYGNQYQRTMDIVTRLNKKGIIDGVGIEMNIDGANPPNAQDIVDTLPTYPIPTYVTDMIVDMKNVPVSTPGRFLKQAKIYEDVTRAAIKGGAKFFFDFQIGDKFTWLEDPANVPLSSPIADPSPYNDDLTPKPALYAQRKALLPVA